MQPYFRDAVRGDLAAIGVILREAEARSSSATPPGGTSRTPVNGTARTGTATTAPSPVGGYREALADIDRTPGNYVLVAEYDNQIIAFLQLLVFRHLHDHGGSTAQIVSLHVAPTYRTTGIAGMLLEHALERCRDLGCVRLQTLSSTARTEEHPFWERHGFVQLDRGYARPV
jgi:GNAT superfamily N-acetyltransferase